MSVVAVGFTDPAANAAWAEGLGYSFEIWSDPDHVVAVHYDAVSDFDPDAPLRHSWILGEDGRAVVKHEGAVSLGADSDLVLADCRTLFSPD